MDPKEMAAKKIERLLDEQARNPVGMCGLTAEGAQDMGAHRVGLPDARQELDAAAAGGILLGERLQPRIAQQYIGQGRRSFDVPAAPVMGRDDGEGARAPDTFEAHAPVTPDTRGGSPIIGSDDVDAELGEIVVNLGMQPRRGDQGFVAVDLRDRGWRPADHIDADDAERLTLGRGRAHSGRSSLRALNPFSVEWLRQSDEPRSRFECSLGFRLRFEDDRNPTGAPAAGAS
jgi:hypothetical protein